MIIDRCLAYLVPGAQFGIEDNDYARVEWLDARPMPTLAECEAAWPVIQAADAAAAQQAASEATNEATLRQRADVALDALAAILVQNDSMVATAQAYLPGADAATAAAVRTQTKALTQGFIQLAQNQNADIRALAATIRLTLRKLDSVQGTAGASAPKG